MSPEEVEVIREEYYQLFKPIFFPELPVKYDILEFFASLLRVVGMEDRGWDPFLESRSILEDLNTVMQMDLPEDGFPNANATKWRMGLFMYSHMIEMDAPYEVVTNLLRYHLGKGYNPNPYFEFLNKDERKRLKNQGMIYPLTKIKIIKMLSKEANLPLGDAFDKFFVPNLRNAISHSDYVMTDDEFRVRNGTGAWGAYSIPLAELDEVVTRCKLFYSMFFATEYTARQMWGGTASRVLPYDLPYKGLLEILTDDQKVMCGFKVHWPNGSDSIYRRTEDGIDMVNCMLAMDRNTVELMVGMYARNPGTFSPLVEANANPVYSAVEGREGPLIWPGDGSV